MTVNEKTKRDFINKTLDLLRKKWMVAWTVTPVNSPGSDIWITWGLVVGKGSVNFHLDILPQETDKETKERISHSLKAAANTFLLMSEVIDNA